MGARARAPRARQAPKIVRDEAGRLFPQCLGPVNICIHDRPALPIPPATGRGAHSEPDAFLAHLLDSIRLDPACVSLGSALWIADLPHDWVQCSGTPGNVDVGLYGADGMLAHCQ